MRKLVVLTCLIGASCNGSATFAPDSGDAFNAARRSSGQALVDEKVDGLRRICTYRSGPINGPRTLTVGRTERCPPNYSVADSTFPPPPTAALKESSIEQGYRACVYMQERSRWTFKLPLSENCPLNAGMAQQAAPNTNNNNSR